jgi:hypothetical protein
MKKLDLTDQKERFECTVFADTACTFCGLCAFGRECIGMAEFERAEHDKFVNLFDGYGLLKAGAMNPF